jgi:hypothetical protein
MIAQIINSTFELDCGKWQRSKEDPQVFVVRFNLHIDHTKEEGYRHLEIALYADANYVKVFVRDDWKVIPVGGLDWNVEEQRNFIRKGEKYTSGVAPWKILCDHDSVWRTTVSDILFENRDRLAYVEDHLQRFYSLIPLSEFLKGKFADPVKGIRNR